MTDKPFEIPQQVRDLTEQNIRQARAAYEQLTEFMAKAAGAWLGVMPANVLTDSYKAVQERAAQFAKKNADAAFALADEIAKAQNIQEILTLQGRFAQDQMQAYAAQAQEPANLIAETAQKAGRG